MSLNEISKFVCPKKKFPIDYDKSAIDAINTIIVPKYDYLLFGSAVFKSLIYAGDIDITQSLPIEKIKMFMQQSLQNILKKGYLVGDIKAGIKYKLSSLLKYLGTIQDGVIINYEPYKIKECAEMHNIQLKYLKLTTKINFSQWIDLSEEIHNIITLRWSKNELLQGFKTENNIKYMLDDVIKHCYNHSLNKIDMYFTAGDRIIEITNVFNPSLINYDINEAVKTIQLNMLKYLMPNFLNYPKAIKRAYTISRIKSDVGTLRKIIPFLTSPINYKASLLTDLNVLSDILDTNKLDDIKQEIYFHLHNLFERLKSTETTFYNKYYEKIYVLMFDINNHDAFNKTLKNIIKELKAYINNLTYTYIKTHDLNLFNLLR